jgi:hypothetical protein
MPKNTIKNLKPKAGPYNNGYYNIKNVSKYIGDPTQIIYRSSWERKFCVFCDSSQSVIKWSSEPFPIKYYSPVDKRIHEYNIDFFMRTQHTNGTIEDYLVEIKPKKKLSKPEPPTKQTLKKLVEYNDSIKEYIINCAKFAAAKCFAAKMGYKFIVLTEDFLYQNA